MLLKATWRNYAVTAVFSPAIGILLLLSSVRPAWLESFTGHIWPPGHSLEPPLLLRWTDCTLFLELFLYTFKILMFHSYICPVTCIDLWWPHGGSEYSSLHSVPHITTCCDWEKNEMPINEWMKCVLFFSPQMVTVTFRDTRRSPAWSRVLQGEFSVSADKTASTS